MRKMKIIIMKCFLVCTLLKENGERILVPESQDSQTLPFVYLIIIKSLGVKQILGFVLKSVSHNILRHTGKVDKNIV